MFWTIIFILIFIVGIAGMTWLFIRKWTELRLLDPESIPVPFEKKKKQELIRQRIERTGLKYVKKAHKDVLRPIGSGAQTIIRTIAGKLTAAERRYQLKKNQQATQEGDLRVIDKLIDEAQRFIDEEIWDQAEKKLIAVISLDARNKQAYELLGRVYLYTKDYTSAKETFEFLNKLSPEDASVIASLGEVAQMLDDQELAEKYFEQAVDLSPRNPKYLDLYLESILKLKDLHKAMIVLDRLVEVNPENKKIEDFEKQIEQLRMKNKKK
ncbi:hypothetical protein KJ673_02635 [Patescibacteria group bacterium]|nr:hypothetical protein [Patescibacteria group bacterium]MBU4452915.1 hypothetical protein [Patescibacteria group bacterium]MCG2687755.1 hypothetical protein [Candidatus Parcubacteria bacterium]